MVCFLRGKTRVMPCPQICTEWPDELGATLGQLPPELEEFRRKAEAAAATLPAPGLTPLGAAVQLQGLCPLCCPLFPLPSTFQYFRCVIFNCSSHTVYSGMPIVGIQYLFIHESGLCGKIQTKAYKYIYIHIPAFHWQAH